MTSTSTRHRTAGSRSVAITGSKGGVGKSNLALNLAVSLSRTGRQILLVDGDLGLANLDVLLGLVPEQTVEHLVRGQARLPELLIEGPAGIRVLPAASGVPDLTKLEPATRRLLLASLSEGGSLADNVLVDTGAGLGETTLALQLAAERVVVVTTPEPTSLVDAYASLKVLWSCDPGKRVDLVVNDAADDQEANAVYEQLARASRHFLNRDPGWLGPVYRDAKVGEAVRRQRAVLDLFPTSRAARCYERIALSLVADDGTDAGPDDYWSRLMDSPPEEPTH